MKYSFQFFGCGRTARSKWRGHAVTDQYQPSPCQMSAIFPPWNRMPWGLLSYEFQGADLLGKFANFWHYVLVPHSLDHAAIAVMSLFPAAA